MFYILDDLGYIEETSSHYIERDEKTCTEYTGTIPESYDSLDDWVLNANIRAYKIVDNNLTYDAVRDAELQEEWNAEPLANEVLLYENEAGSAEAITLSETAANFKYIEIFYKNNDNTFSSVKVYKPNSKEVEISSITRWSSTIYLKQRRATISGTSISKGTYSETSLTATPKISIGTSSNPILITRVIGYRGGV